MLREGDGGGWDHVVAAGLEDRKEESGTSSDSQFPSLSFLFFFLFDIRTGTIMITSIEMGIMGRKEKSKAKIKISVLDKFKFEMCITKQNGNEVHERGVD